jgi:hypothetical protein
MSQISDAKKFDSQHVAGFLGDFMKFTGHSFFHVEERSQELDNRIHNAELSLADKIEVFKRLSPRAEDSRLGAISDERKELRMERLLLSAAPEDLSLFKFVLEYDEDYKDLEEYIFHDIDKKEYQDRIIKHFREAPQPIGLKVLTDVDDTMYANLIDKRYPKKTLYPGVLEFYDALKREPFALQEIPLTTLSARPNPIAGKLEEASLRNLVELTKGRLCPSALSGDLGSSVIGTLETLERADLHPLHDKIPHGQEDQIGRVKFENFARFAQVYPEYSYVFVGDSGQADALTAQLMVAQMATEDSLRVVTTFIHDLRQSEDDESSVSQTFRNLPTGIIVGKNTSPTDAGRGVIVFRNYIEAALIAYSHSATIGNAITAEGLARITRAALEQFQTIDFPKEGKEESKQRLRKQYREDAEEAHKQLTAAILRLSSFAADVAEIRRILDERF